MMQDLLLDLAALAAPTAAPRPPRPGMAPFALLRAAALPLQMLDDLRLPETEARVARIVAAEQVLAAHRGAVADALHASVPRIAADDNATRRQVLALKRDVHNGRDSAVKPAQRDIARALLANDAERAAFDAWAAAQQDRVEALAALEPGLLAELQAVTRPALRRPLARATFRRGLAFASAGVERSAAREKRLPTPPTPDNLERSLLGYLARASAKTSPFSSFMSLSVVGIAPEAAGAVPRGDAVAYRNTVHLNRGAAARLHRLALPEAGRAGDLLLRTNPTLKRGANQRVHGLCSREVVLLGRPWWEQRFAQFRLEPAVWQALQQPGAAPWSHWVQVLRAQGMDAATADATVVKMLERGVLLPPELSDAFDDAPLRRLAELWAASRSPALRAHVPALQQLLAQADAVATAQGEARIALLDGVRAAQQGLEAALAATPPEPLHNLVLEDCWVSGVQGEAGPELLAPLQDLQTFLAGQVVESGYYRRLRDHFVARFGAGGTCTDAVEFLLEVADKLVDVPEFGARWSGEAPVAAQPGVCVPVTAQVQIAAGRDGRPPCVVVNRVFDGAGWLAARFTNGDQPGQRELRDRLVPWLQRVSGHREPVDMPIGGHCSDLQAHRRLTPRVLRWPGEPLTLPDDEVIDAAALRIRHNPQTGLLDVTDADGRPLNLMYLGTTFPSPIWGLRYALSILTQPYLIARPDFAPPADRVDTPVRFEPRLVQGALVLRRATWWVSTAHLREHWFAGTPGERLLAARREADRWQLPPVFFAQRHQPPAERGSLVSADVLNANRKPLWIDLRNPLWLAMLERLAEEGEWLTFTEPLPGPDELWLELDGQRHVSELQIEMLIEAGRPNNPFPLTSQGDAP